MIIQLNKFGTTLISRQAGKEAFGAFRPTLELVPSDEPVEVSFEGITTFSPSWGDEFLTPLATMFGDRLSLQKTDNLSVTYTIKMLEDISKKQFGWV